MIAMNMLLLMTLFLDPAPSAAPPGPDDWPGPVRMAISEADARELAEATATARPIEPGAARRIALAAGSAMGRVPVYRGLDGLWEMRGERHGITWRHGDRWELRAWIELLEQAEIEAGDGPMVRPVPHVIHMIGWAKWRARRAGRDR
jgi:hypothetical protein